MNGWTVDRCRQGMRDCLIGIREAKQRGGPSLWTYRFLFVRMYQQNKARLFALKRGEA